MQKNHIFGFATLIIVVNLILSSCNKQNMQQPPTSQLTTTAANLKTDATGVLLTDATVLAQQFLQTKNPGKTITIKSAETVTKNGVPYMHIINADNNLGYAIFSADSMYVPLLAFDSMATLTKTT